MMNSQKEGEKMKKFKFQYFDSMTFLAYLALTIIGIFVGCTAPGFLGLYAMTTILGILLMQIGDSIPLFYKYVGGGAFIAIFGSALIRYLNIFPEDLTASIDNFVKKEDYIGLVVGALICGSILTMDRKLLIKAGSRYFFPILGGIFCAFALTGVIGAISGYGWRESILFVSLPIMGGGTSAGAVPTALAYEARLSHDQAYYLTLMMPAVCIGNAVSVVIAGLLNGMGKRHPEWTGNGSLMKSSDLTVESKSEDKEGLDPLSIGRGLVGTAIFYIIGKLLAKYIPIGIHYYAWTILACAVFKISGLVPEGMQRDMKQWYTVASKAFIPAVFFTIGFTYMDLKQVIESFSLIYLVMIIATVFGAVIGSWLMGKLVGFHPIESSITAGLCMANMGGSGDVAVLGAADRMCLMPFAQISSRIGGALIIIIANILAVVIGAGL